MFFSSLLATFLISVHSEQIKEQKEEEFASELCNILKLSTTLTSLP